MPTFRYRALDPDGVRFASTIEADTAAHAVELLRVKELELQSIELDSGERNDDDWAPDRGGPRLEPRADHPPPAPRAIEPGSVSAPGGVVLLFVGGLFVLVASIFIIVGLSLLASGDSNGWMFTLFPMIHFSVGAGLLWYSLTTRAARRRIAEHGDTALARITSTGFDTRVRVNGRNPFKLGYEFEVDGASYSGKYSTLNSDITQHELHDRIWVLYDPSNPSKSIPWPLV